jgi:hypothetical protein
MKREKKVRQRESVSTIEEEEKSLDRRMVIPPLPDLHLTFLQTFPQAIKRAVSHLQM